VAVFPLVSNKEGLVAKAREVFELVSATTVAQYDDGGAIGRRYRRHDEIGTPLCITIDHDSLDDNAVTLRERDSMKQVRISIEELPAKLAAFFAGSNFSSLT